MNDDEMKLKRKVQHSARKRATVKHKNTGQWVKAMKAQ